MDRTCKLKQLLWAAPAHSWREEEETEERQQGKEFLRKRGMWNLRHEDCRQDLAVYMPHVALTFIETMTLKTEKGNDVHING